MDKNQNIPSRLNNPGSLKDPSTGQFRQFNSPQEGFAALMNDLEAKKSGRSQTGLGPQSSLVDFAKVYAPASDKNNPAQYAANIANHMKIRPDAQLSSLDTGKWAEAVAHSEGYAGTGQNMLTSNSVSTAPAAAASTEQKPGFIQGIAQSVASPFLKAISSTGAILESGKGLMKSLSGKDTTQEQQNLDKINKEGFDYGYLGKARPIGSEYNDKGEKQGFGRRLADTIGTGIDAASTVLPVEGVGAKVLGEAGGFGTKAIEAASKGKFLKAAAKGGIEGATIGGLQGLGSGLQKSDASVGSVAANTIEGGLAGGALGGVTGGMGGILGKASKENRINNTIEKRSSSLAEVENKYASMKDAVAAGDKVKFNVRDAVAKTNLLDGSINNDGIIQTQGAGGAMSKLNEVINPHEADVRNILEKEGNSVAVKDVQDFLLKKVDGDRMLKGGAKIRARNEVLQDIEGLKLDAKPDGTIPLTAIHDAKIAKTNPLNYDNPQVKISSKTIGSGLKELVEKNSGANIGAINKDLQKLYLIRDYLDALDGKIVKGGRLGKYFAQGVGAAIGSHFGPVGTYVGSEASRGIYGAMIGRKLGGKVGKALEASPVLQEAQARGEGLIRKLKVKSEPSNFTNEVPTIQAGATPKSRLKKADKSLPTIKF